MSTWILYNIQTGTILENDPTEPTGYSPDKATANVDFNFLPSQPLYFLRYNGSAIEANSEVNIKLFEPFQSGEIETLPTKEMLSLIVEHELNQVVYVQEYNISYWYNGSIWEQCGQEVALRYGLGLGFIYALDVEIG